MSNGKNDLNISKNEKFRIVIIPADLLDTIKEKLGDEFIWDFDKDTHELFLMKKPVSYTDYLSGLGEDMWKETEGTDYIHRERKEWKE